MCPGTTSSERGGMAVLFRHANFLAILILCNIGVAVPVAAAEMAAPMLSSQASAGTPPSEPIIVGKRRLRGTILPGVGQIG